LNSWTESSLPRKKLRTQSAGYVYNYTLIAELSKICSCFRSCFWLWRGLLVVGNNFEYSLRSRVSLVIHPVPKSGPMQVRNCAEDECRYPVTMLRKASYYSDWCSETQWAQPQRQLGKSIWIYVLKVNGSRRTIIESRPTPFYQALYWTKLCTRGNKTVFPSSYHTQTSFCRIAFHFCCIFCRKILSDKDSYGETNQLINALKPGCAGVSHVPWLAASPGEMTVRESLHHAHLAGYLDQAILWERMASVRAKPITIQFPSVLLLWIPVVSSR